MIVAEYLNHLWVQLEQEALTIGYNYLISRGIPYVEINEYFSKNYGIAIDYATYYSTNTGVKLQLILKDKQLDAKTLYMISENAVFGSDTDWTEEKGEYSYSYILLDIDQNIEAL